MLNYNIHPLFVHFPVALLFLYSIIKILPLKKYFPKISWKHIEVTLLVVGFGGALTALYTGEIAKHLVEPNRQLVRTHSLFANISTWVYGILLAGEFLAIANPYIIARSKYPKLNSLLLWKQQILTSPLVSNTLAILGLVAISITGMLGGVMVYGVSADPVAGVVVGLLGLSI